MQSQYRNVWFVNLQCLVCKFFGIGNGIVIIPILRCFEKSYPATNYYHTENQILADPWFLGKAGLKNLKGLSPSVWRRFKEEDWFTISSFVKEKNIDLIVNLRNEGPRYDIGYYRFKEEEYKKNIPLTFWDLDFGIIEHRTKYQNLTGDILKFFKTKGVDITVYNPKWLNTIRKIKDQEGVGFGVAASQTNKRWPTAKWIGLARKILAGSDEKIVLLPGQSEKEIEEAKFVIQHVGQKKCRLITNESVGNIALQIGELKCFVSNDTGFLHIAVAIGVPTTGLYVSTNSEIWSPYDKTNFFALQNSFITKCLDSKPHCGNCFHYYDICPAIARYGDDIDVDEVYKIISRQLIC
ncbi:MAG: glycosyltransferase family 9 protein [Patescibacteria group bacterium]